MISEPPAEIVQKNPEPAAGSPLPVNEEPQSPDHFGIADTDSIDFDLDQPDAAQPDGKEPSSIPYKRFKEVISERNKLRDQIDSLQRMQDQQPQPNPYLDMYSDEELSMLFRENPVEATKTVFSQFLTHIQESNRLKDQSLGQAIERYPEIADPQSPVAQMARSILSSEIPDLHDLPQGPAIAAEIAAARYYKDQYQQLARKQGINLQSLEATRNANLRNAHMEHSGNNVDRSYGPALSSEEQRVAKLMGVPSTNYARYKRDNDSKRRS